MLTFAKPTDEKLRRFLNAQSKLGFTYAATGATASQPPAGYIVDHTRFKLGHGEAVFQAGRAALEHWEQFNLGWLRAWPTQTPIRTGATVAIVARAAAAYWSSACRIVYVVDDSGPVARFGFAYGTLPDHPGTGEERFQVEWNRADDSVWFDILAFSRPSKLLFRLAYPMMRQMQRRFARDAQASMLRATGAASKIPAAAH